MKNPQIEFRFYKYSVHRTQAIYLYIKEKTNKTVCWPSNNSSRKGERRVGMGGGLLTNIYKRPPIIIRPRRKQKQTHKV